MDPNGHIYKLPEEEIEANKIEHREAATRLDGFLRGRSEADLLQAASALSGAGVNRFGEDDQRP